MRAIKGWMYVHHSTFSIFLGLSAWFAPTVHKESNNFGVVLQEVNEPPSVSMNKTMGLFDLKQSLAAHMKIPIRFWRRV